MARHDTAGGEGAVEADARPPRHAVVLQAPRVGLEVLLRVLAGHAALDGKPVDGGHISLQGSREEEGGCCSGGRSSMVTRHC